MTLAAGTRLGPYEITAKLGAGGMGEVYRATDSKLRREVAVKVLPAAFTEDQERLARFEREAQLLAQLHHPNIASIFGLEESGGVRALVMELVEGPTLGERLQQGPLPFDGAVYQAPSAVSPDGRRLLFERTDAQGSISLWIRALEGPGEDSRIGSSTASEFSADLSPDGRWVAYVSDATRTWEVYIRRVDGAGGGIRISNEGGIQPLWRRDGRELFYLDPRGRLVAVPIAPGDPLQPGAPEPLFDARLEEAVDRQYDAFNDGQRFVLNRAQVSARTPIIVVLDWTALLDRKAE